MQGDMYADGATRKRVQPRQMLDGTDMCGDERICRCSGRNPLKVKVGDDVRIFFGVGGLT